MQLSVFSTDDRKSGFRLQHMEVFNWGTFDGQIHAIRPGGEGCLLTGANGSGKTTFVDALLTLIVPEKRYRFYNQSSGSERKGDRTEESYVLGGYNTVHSEQSGGSRVLYLREQREEAYSILLACFSNEADQFVTLFQVRYFSGSEMKRVFGIAHVEMHIEQDFRPFDHKGDWKRRLEQVYNKGGRRQVEFFDAASRYAQRLVDVLGMQSMQALILFNQTVGIKVLDNLDEFIRTHMLEPRNMEEPFQALKTHMSTLLDAQRNIEKVEEQIRLLEPLSGHIAVHAAALAEEQEVRTQLETSVLWKAFTHDTLLAEAVLAAERESASLQIQADAARQRIAELHEEERQIRNQSEQNKAGQRIAQLERDLAAHESARESAALERTAFTGWCATLQLEEQDPVNEAAYTRIKRAVERDARRIEREERLNEDDEFEARRARLSSDDERTRIEQELQMLQQHRSNIRGDLVDLRRRLCADLDIPAADLPFAGELMQVADAEREWQPALEKLLHNFALRLLVPDKYYKRFTRHVNQQDLRTRLVYYRVGDSFQSHPTPDSVCTKLEFHPDHHLSGWVRQEVIRLYDHVCITDDRHIERYDRAITLRGLVKDRQRHEKDDRPGSSDPSRYVLGWDNTAKKEFLLTRRTTLVETIRDSDETLRRCRQRKERLANQQRAASQIAEHRGFPGIDTEGWQRRIHDVEKQIAKLREGDDQLRQLQLQLEAVIVQRNHVELERDEQVRRLNRLSDQCEEMRKQRNELASILELVREEERDELMRFPVRFAAELEGVTIENINEVYTKFREARQARERDARVRVHEAEGLIQRAIDRIQRPSAQLIQRFPDWLGDVQHLPEDARHAQEYEEWLTALRTENLPRFKRDFENYINDTITYKIGGFNEDLERWERDIQESIRRLNSSLSGINFNRAPDTYIQLGRRTVVDANIRSFRHRLLEALPQAADWQRSGFEEKALHFRQKVQPLIEELDADERYRSRVLDVRNWSEFWADERYRNTDELRKSYRQMGQLSGGEKPQLTYTILCSAIAYQFGITREGKNSRSLRFIAVDESFSNQDEDKATYLMDLCKQLHLQLLVVTPSDKIQIVQDYIAHVHLVQRVNDRHSVIYNMTIKELKEKIEQT
jgi:uncharacterized protein YPO0396